MHKDIEPLVSRDEAVQHAAVAAAAMTQLEQELAETQERLRATIEKYETALEGLKSANEGLVAANEQQRLLVAELNHRVRNMLQVVIGLANQTLHKSNDLQYFEQAFFGRMQALARAYELLSRDGWHKVPVVELLRTQIAPFMSEGGRYTAEGDYLVLSANAALSMGLVLYELATNATKYGALSLPTGHVQVKWWIEDRAAGGKEFILKWSESGGPSVNPPTRHGFGSELVQRQLKYELNGRSTMDFAATGLIVTLVIPAQEALEPADAAGAQA